MHKGNFASLSMLRTRYMSLAIAMLAAELGKSGLFHPKRISRAGALGRSLEI